MPGSKPGERRGGRQKGTRNKITAPVKVYAAQFDTEAIDGIVAVARNPDTPPQVKIMAWNSLLDRGHGRPAQSVGAGDGESTGRRLVIVELDDRSPSS